MDMRIPKELRKVVVAPQTAVPPGQLWQMYTDKVECAQGDPGAILESVRMCLKSDDDLDLRFMIAALTELGSSFDFNSFWGSADKQILTKNVFFKYLIADLIEQADSIPSSAVPQILYSLACLEYRPARLMRPLIADVRVNLQRYTLPVLSHLAFSVAMLNPAEEEIVHELLTEAMNRWGDFPETGSLHDWAQLAFTSVLHGAFDGGLQAFVRNAVSHIRTTAQLSKSGWAQFFIYQTMYAVDVERPSPGLQLAIPGWVQEHLDYRWLDRVITHCQPQGSDLLQLDVDAALKRTNTQAILNCSAGRDTDEKHCWFVGHRLSPKIAFEYNSHLACEKGENRPSGWVALKTRLLQKCGYSVVVIHKALWEKLDEKQKDEQIMYFRAKLGYLHEASSEDAAKSAPPTRSLKEGKVKWEDQPDWVPHLREPELHFTVHGYKPKDNPGFKGGVQVNKRRRFIANGNHNWVNSLAPKG